MLLLLLLRLLRLLSHHRLRRRHRGSVPFLLTRTTQSRQVSAMRDHLKGNHSGVAITNFGASTLLESTHGAHATSSGEQSQSRVVIQSSRVERYVAHTRTYERVPTIPARVLLPRSEIGTVIWYPSCLLPSFVNLCSSRGY